MPQARHGFKARHVLFRADGVGLMGMARKEEIEMKDAKVCMTEIICHAVETIAICVVIGCIGCKALDKLSVDNDGSAKNEPKEQKGDR